MVTQVGGLALRGLRWDVDLGVDNSMRASMTDSSVTGMDSLYQPATHSREAA